MDLYFVRLLEQWFSAVALKDQIHQGGRMGLPQASGFSLVYRKVEHKKKTEQYSIV